MDANIHAYMHTRVQPCQVLKRAREGWPKEEIEKGKSSMEHRLSAVACSRLMNKKAQMQNLTSTHKVYTDMHCTPRRRSDIKQM